MQYHVSRNGHQLGKVSEADLRAGFAEGHFLATDLVWRDGMAQWTPLGEVLKTPATGPSLVKSGSSSGAPAIRAASATGNNTLPAGAAPASGLALTSLISGITSIVLCGLGGIATLTAIITGHMALSRINKAGGISPRKGMAVTGLILGYVSIVTAIFGIAITASMAIPVFAKIQEKGIITKQISLARQAQVACQIYAADNGGKYPATLEELVGQGILTPEIMKELDSLKPPGWVGEPGFEYLGEGKNDTALAETEILVSRAESRRGERIVGRHDGSVMLEKRDE
ncbi:uncharacterized protein DUF4190 [Roseimicrobium gellanilyticum]|uniref:Uncharacterized protein DUF4190 n=1 Tax=Roseimicrobium gellanilyticum TaxID=748857 RepID=A0A366HSG2_9BACT|nr:GYF domain-containing protein [Roseimicrobium gellanilyticum]RBP47221.1 uncharacterized protein DUF4190 [Roseimicrobium gellanilyticum]